MHLRAEIIDRMSLVRPDEWDALDATGNPFLRHAFLDALEATDCVGPGTGWQPGHLVIRDPAGSLLAAVPQYLKAHSWGEFVFDWSWARACEQAGLNYYPKLLSAVPFTPVTGPRLLVGARADSAELRRTVAGLLQRLAIENDCSGVHVNFTLPEDQAALESAGFMRRHDLRFLWRNRGYRDFDDFLAGFRAQKRKKLHRERRKVAEAGISFRTLHGEEIDGAMWQRIFGFSQSTFLRHGAAHYLNTRFLELLSERMPGSVMVKLAERGGEAVGAALFIRGSDCLYGRYWGSAGREDSLHFEACYYQGIEYCIERGIALLDPGTQGEHKLARGFEPTLTSSAHWLAHDGLASAVRGYLERERQVIAEYAEAARQHLPFHRESGE
jgi:hypothetical protein